MLSKTHRALVEEFTIHDCPLLLGKLNDCLKELKETIAWNRWSTEHKVALIKATDAYAEALKDAEEAHAQALQRSSDDGSSFGHLISFVNKIQNSVIPHLNTAYLPCQAYCEEIQRPNQLLLYWPALQKTVSYFMTRWESVRDILHGRVVRESDRKVHPEINDISISRTVQITAETTMGDRAQPLSAPMIVVELRIHMRVRIHHMTFRVHTADGSIDTGIKGGIEHTLQSVKDDSQRRWLTALASSLQDEDDYRPFVRLVGLYLLDMCEMVVRDNPSMLRQSRISIDITVLQKRDDVMAYDIARSSPGQVFLFVNGGIAITEYMSCTGVPARGAGMYQAFLHELMHAKDAALNKPHFDPKLSPLSHEQMSRLDKELRALIGDVHYKETMVLFGVLHAARHEGLAKLGEFLGYAHNGVILFSVEQVLPNLQFALQRVQDLIDGMTPEPVSTDVVSVDPVQRFSQDHLQYAFGLFCALVIAAQKMGEHLELFKTTRMRDQTSLDRLENLRPQSVRQFLFHEKFDVGMRIGPECQEQFRQAINNISMMSMREFFRAFFNACDHFGLRGLFRIHYRTLDDVSREKEALLIACGFKKERFGRVKYPLRMLWAKIRHTGPFRA